ncbi:MAG: response regulator [Chloroflexota bacterium]|nr:response regulator [Chloroflexota bacterium]
MIDDDPDYMEFTRIILESGGYSVSCAYNAEQGLSLMRTEHPDVVLLDMLMSYTMEGLDVTRAMRETPELRNIPLIVISAVLTDANALQSENEESPSISAFLTKPVEPGELLSRVAEAISRAEGRNRSRLAGMELQPN